MDYKTIILTIALMGLSTSMLISQSSKKQEVHLKDGTVLIGDIIEDSDYMIKLVISTGDTLDLGYKYIDHIGPKKDRVKRKREPLVLPDGGWTIDVAAMNYIGGDRPSSWELMTGKIISKQQHAGLLLRYRPESYNIRIWRGDQHYMDIGAFYRHFINKKTTVRFFAEASAGISVLLDDNSFQPTATGNHPHASLSIGTRLMGKSRLGFTVKAGMAYHKTTVSTTEAASNITFDFLKESFSPHVTIGLNF